MDIMDGYAILHLSSALSDTSGLMLKVGKRIFTEEESDFRRYDDVSKTILVHPGEDVLAEMASDRVPVSVVSDMKFLIIAVRDFFKTYGPPASRRRPSGDRIPTAYPEDNRISHWPRIRRPRIRDREPCPTSRGQVIYPVRARLRS